MYSSPYHPPPAGYMPSPAYRAPPAYYASYQSTPTKGHTRRASHEPSAYAYATPKRSANYHTPPVYAPSQQYATAYVTPKRPDFVSATYERPRTGDAARRYAFPDGFRQTRSTPRKHTSSKSQYYHISVDYDDEGYSSPGRSPPPPYDGDNVHHQDARCGYADGYERTQGSGHGKQKSTRTRSTSHPQPPAYDAPPSSKARPASSAKAASSPREATPADAMAAGIPAGYSYKYWDPSEEPILLLGSVFDANSLGRWIYDWTVYHYGASTPMADLAGDLWLLLIQLASKIKRAEETLPRVRRLEDRDLVEDFLESGERLWGRFGRILKVCEDYMWKVAKRDGKRSGSSKPAMGPKTGFEFVDSIFGRDRQLESTEKLMTGMRLWSMRFDANCEDILRRPAA